uniref:G-protein coupled receptors family 1 profile domain-containing protein n=1 Tax=Trichuris muris TaxID=70415 RepID=A0A5S6QTW4_TRIMR
MDAQMNRSVQISKTIANFTQRGLNVTSGVPAEESSGESYEQTVRNWIFVVSGILGIFTNAGLLTLIYRSNDVKARNKFIAGYALGSAVLGVGYIVDHARQLEPSFEWPVNMSPLNCMISCFNITLFKIGDLLVVISILYMSIDGLTAIIPGINPYTKEKAVNALGWLTAMVIVLDVVLAWISAALNKTILPICYHRAIVGEYSFLIHYWGLVCMGYLSTIFYVIAIIMLKRRKAASSGIREIQMKREYEVMKQIILIIGNCFLLEAVPVSLELSCSFLRFNPAFANSIWLLQAMNLSVYAIFRILKHPLCRSHFKRILTISQRTSKQLIGSSSVTKVAKNSTDNRNANPTKSNIG